MGINSLTISLLGLGPRVIAKNILNAVKHCRRTNQCPLVIFDWLSIIVRACYRVPTALIILVKSILDVFVIIHQKRPTGDLIGSETWSSLSGFHP
jgi:hypothetical protein